MKKTKIVVKSAAWLFVLLWVAAFIYCVIRRFQYVDAQVGIPLDNFISRTVSTIYCFMSGSGLAISIWLAVSIFDYFESTSIVEGKLRTARKFTLIASAVNNLLFLVSVGMLLLFVRKNTQIVIILVLWLFMLITSIILQVVTKTLSRKMRRKLIR